MATYVPVRAASVCQRIHEEASAVVARAEEVDAPVREEDTVEKMFQTELKFWYCENAPYEHGPRKPIEGRIESEDSMNEREHQLLARYIGHWSVVKNRKECICSDEASHRMSHQNHPPPC